MTTVSVKTNNPVMKSPASTNLDRLNVIDDGCTTLQGLVDRCQGCFMAVHGPGKIFNHAEGLVYESTSGYRILVRLATQPKPDHAPGV